MYRACRSVITTTAKTLESRLGSRPWTAATATSTGLSPVTNDACCNQCRSYHHHHPCAYKKDSSSSSFSCCGGSNSGTGFRSFSTTATTNPVELDRENEGEVRDSYSSSSSSSSRSSNKNESFDSQLQRFFASTSPHLSKHHVLELIKRACKKNSLHGMQLAQDIVERWILLTSSSSSSTAGATNEHPPAGMDSVRARTTLDMWQEIVYGWGVLAPKHPVAMHRMKEILERIVEEVRVQSEQQPPTIPGQRRLPPPTAPTVDLFNTYLGGLAVAALSPNTSRMAVARARAVLNEMTTYSSDYGWWCRPNTRSFMNVLAACKNSRLPKAGESAMQVLQQMVDAHIKQKQEYKEQYGENYQEGTARRKIVTPDAPAYSLALEAITHSMGDKKQNVRSFLQNLPLSTVNFDAKFWVSVIHAHAKLVDQEGYVVERIRIAQEAERFLHDVVVKNTDDKQVLLTAWNACLDTWSRVYAKEAPLECERLLQSMLSDNTIMANATSFNACHYAWSRSTGFYDNAAQKSLELLQLQNELGHPSARPDYQSYAIVILAFGNANQVHEARSVLDSMLTKIPELLALPESRNPAAPFSALLSCIAKYRVPAADETKSHKRDTTTEGSSVSSNSKGDDNALWEGGAEQDDLYSLALRTYNEVTKDLYGLGAKPDHHTFSAMLRCIAAHSNGLEKQTRSQEVFDAACEAGEVSRTVVDGLVAVLGEAEAQQRLRRMPQFWCRNVPAGYRRQSWHKNAGGAKRSPKFKK